MKALGAALVLAAALGVAARAAAVSQQPSATQLLDRYLSGQFDDVVAALATTEDFDDFLKQLERDGEAWVDAGDAAVRTRRELAAATLALEAAHVGERTRWKVTTILGVEGGYEYRITYWEAPSTLVEWGCALLRRTEQPGPLERWWQLAANALSQRAEDDEFLYGDVNFPGRYDRKTMISPTIKIEHLRHLRHRFPHEPRFQIAEPIALEWIPTATDVATKMFTDLQNDIDVGGEATLRLGAMALRRATQAEIRTVVSGGGVPAPVRRVSPQSELDAALAHFRRAESLTRDPWVIYLARYLSGRVWDVRNRPIEAERAYRAAVATIPRAQSASVALGTLLFRQGRRAEGSSLVERVMGPEPMALDPWREYADADYRFWPELIARLRTEIRR